MLVISFASPGMEIILIFFIACSGVKQGGVLSPVLFCVYIDGLLLTLTKAGIGCYVGHIFVGAPAYADDIAVIAPTPSALRRMLAMCDKSANEYHIRFNANKSICLAVFPRGTQNRRSYLGDCLFNITMQWNFLTRSLI